MSIAGEIAEKQYDELNRRVEEALALAISYGQIDGAHHKTWVIDQVVRILAGPQYDELITASCAGEDGPETYGWDTGIAP